MRRGDPLADGGEQRPEEVCPVGLRREDLEARDPSLSSQGHRQWVGEHHDACHGCGHQGDDDVAAGVEEGSPDEGERDNCGHTEEDRGHHEHLG